jgi:AcrR family transcriptional regulator
MAARTRQARSVETRARLLDAATAVIARHGIEGASVDAISDRAERTSGSLYSQFGSKDALVVELLDRSKDVVARQIADELTTTSTLDERLGALWRNFADPPGAARDWLRLERELWVWATRPGNEAARDRLARRYAGEFATLGAALAEWTAEGLIDPPLPPAAMAAALMSTLLGLEMTHRLDPGLVDDTVAVRTLAALLGRATHHPVSPGTPVPPATANPRR